MAVWKKVIVSGSNAELNQITASGGISAILPSSTQPNFISYNSTTGQFGFAGTGSFTAATASFVTSSNVFGPFGSNSILSASFASSSATVTVVDTTTGTGPYYIMFADGTTGNRAVRVDSAALTFNATTNTLTVTSSYATQALSASFASTASFLTPGTYAITASWATNAVSASFASTASNIGNAISNNVDNRVLTATGTGTINGESNLTFDGSTLTVTGNAIITNNLTVQGTASFQNTSNLQVADRFVLFASGSNTAGDGGIIVQQATQDVGELFGYENSINRWGFTSSFSASQASFNASAYVTTTEVGVATPSAAPLYGGSSNGFGNIYVKTDTGDIFIYA